MRAAGDEVLIGIVAPSAALGTNMPWGSSGGHEITPDTAKAPEAKEPLAPLDRANCWFGGYPLRTTQGVQLVVRCANEAGGGTILAATRGNVLLQVVMGECLVLV